METFQPRRRPLTTVLHSLGDLESYRQQMYQARVKELELLFLPQADAECCFCTMLLCYSKRISKISPTPVVQKSSQKCGGENTEYTTFPLHPCTMLSYQLT